MVKNARPTDDVSRARCNAEGQSGQVGELLRSAYLVVMVLEMILVILMVRMMINLEDEEEASPQLRW